MIRNFTKLFLSNIINHGESDYNNQLVYKVVIWAIFLISLWTENVVLNICICNNHMSEHYLQTFPYSFLEPCCILSAVNEAYMGNKWF